MKYFSNYGAGYSIAPTAAVAAAFADCQAGPVRHMRLFVSAPTKVAALTTIAACGFASNDTYLCVGKMPGLEELASTGILDDGAVYVARSGTATSPLLRVTPENVQVVAILDEQTLCAAA